MLLVLLLLFVHANLLAWSALCHSPTMDEVGHLPAGIRYWHTGSFELYCVNPPLTRLLAAAPVVLARPRTDWYSLEADSRPEWQVGMDFIAANGGLSFWYFTLARWACIPLSLLAGYICYRWAAELYGPAAGLLALTLWCFSPTVLAYAALITPDAGASALGVAAGYFFWRWLRQPSWVRAAVAGSVLGLAELTRTSWIILFGLWPLWWLVLLWHATAGRGRWLAQAGQLATVLLLALFLVNAAYGFEGTFQKLGRYRFVSASLGTAEGGNRFAGRWLGEMPVPLPRCYVVGVDLQKRDFERGNWSYLCGEHRHGGWWYYYLFALAVKEPLGTWALVLLAAGYCGWRARYSAGWPHELILLAPALAVLALVSSQTGFSRYLRYALPALPFAFIWASKVARSWPLRQRGLAVAAAAALAWSVGSSLAVYPHSLSYFNELAGGPAGGHRYLIDANVDWGQDMFFLKAWYDEHPEARPLRFVGVGPIPPWQFGIATERDLEARQPGWYAFSVSRLHDPKGQYDDFLDRRPVARVGYSIHIYHLAQRPWTAPRSRWPRLVSPGRTFRCLPAR